jgi:hypothetical protein
VLAKSLAGAFGNIIKENIKAATSSLPDATAQAAPSTPVKPYEFIACQNDNLIDQKYATLDASVGIEAVAEESLARDPDSTLAAVAALTESVKASAKQAGMIQAHQTVQHWIRYVASQKIGTRWWESEEPVDMRRVNHPAGEGELLDGVVDVRFTASLTKPEQPAMVVGARVTGVADAAVRMLATQSILDTDLPIRVSGAPSGNQAATPLTVVRDDKHHVSYSDGDHLPLPAGTWFERKGRGDAYAGATALLRELLEEPLGDLLQSDDKNRKK